MAYTDDAVLAKLSALNETHDSIATAAQWIMFHRRHAERTVQLWFQRLKDSPSPKRLNLVYLANEVTQQSKARHKDDFVLAFAPVIAEAIASAYKGAPSEVQTKLRRVVEVWRERSIFEQPIQAAVESRIEELDKAKGASRTAIGGGSIFGNSSSSSSSSSAAAAALPQEFAPLVAPQRSVTKLLISTQGAASKADSEYEKIMNNPPPAAPVFAARLNGLLKTIADGEDAIAQMVRARTDLKTALDNLQAQYQKLLEADKQRLARLAQRRVEVDERKRQVEDKIMRDLSGNGNNGGSNGNGTDSVSPGGHSGAGSISPIQEPPRPEVEALTPPSNDPDDMGEPVFPGLDLPQVSRSESRDVASESGAASNGNSVSPAPPQVQVTPASDPSVSGIDILSQLASQAVPVSANGVNKRRRVDSSEEVPDLDDGIDADVTEMLRKESQS